MHRRGEKIKERISPSLFPQPQLITKSQSIVSKYGKNSDSCNKFLACRNEFTCNAAGKS